MTSVFPTKVLKSIYKNPMLEAFVSRSFQITIKESSKETGYDVKFPAGSNTSSTHASWGTKGFFSSVARRKGGRKEDKADSLPPLFLNNT